MTLLFSGRRYRQARLRSTHQDWFHEIDTTGGGQEWNTDKPAAFWRNFAEMDLQDGKAVERFFQRHGDPTGVLAAGTPTHTGSWLGLAAVLRAASRAWEPPSADGVSRLTGDRERLAEARCFLGGDRDREQLAKMRGFRDAEPHLLRDVTLRQYYRTGGLVLYAGSLASYMAVSAAHHLEAATPMRVCVECGDYFALGRADARFCSPRCQVAHHRRPDTEKMGEA